MKVREKIALALSAALCVGTLFTPDSWVIKFNLLMLTKVFGMMILCLAAMALFSYLLFSVFKFFRLPFTD